ncbi:hypothetical protein Tco_1334979 [Tanacetum coccineum]
MVLVPIHQDTSSIPPMTTLVIDLMKSQSDSPLPTSTTTTSTITTSTTLPLPLLQITTDPFLVRRIGELEQHIADLIQNNLGLDERLDKHGSRLYKLENLNIPHQVSKAVDEIEAARASGAPGSQAPSSSKAATLNSQPMAWMTFDTQYESDDILRAQELSPTDYLMQDDSILEE